MMRSSPAVDHKRQGNRVEISAAMNADGMAF
jgi:hypothetical protein